MFHYRLIQDNRARMFVAVCLAIAAHLGLLSFKFQLKPYSAPGIALPSSISVFLSKKHDIRSEPEKIDRQSLKQIDKQAELPIPREKVVKKVEQKKNILPEVILTEQKDQPVVSAVQKTEPGIEEIIPDRQYTEKEAEFPTSKAVGTKETELAAIEKTSKADSEENGVRLPGTLQMAYPHYRLNTPPTYPGLARKRGQTGTVLLQVLVNPEGRVDDLQVDISSGFSLLDRAAVNAVRKWTFEPGRRGEEKISMWVKVPVTFKLK